MPAEREYRAEFEEFTGNEDPETFEAFMTIFEESGAADDLDTWFEFLNTFYPDTESHSKDFWDDMREAFYEYSGVTGENIDWELWRAIVEEVSPGGA